MNILSNPMSVMKVVLAQKSNIDASTALLAGMDGVAGYVGFDRFVTAITDAESQRDKARKDAKALTDTVDIGTRKYLGLDSGAAVQPAQRAEFTKALAATGEDAPKVVLKKGDPPPSKEPSTVQIISEKEIDALADAMVDALKDETPALAKMSKFADTFLKVFIEQFNGGDTVTVNEATLEWATKAAGVLKTAATAHKAAEASETDVLVWAETKLSQ